MFTIEIKMTNDDDIANAIAKLQGLLDENGKWVFAWSQETKEKIFDPQNHTRVNFVESKARYERCIKDSGRSFFDFMNWTKAQGVDSPFVTFEDRLLDAVHYASSNNFADITQTQEYLLERLDVLALRIDPLIQKAGVSVAEYNDSRDESVRKLYTYADEMFHKLISVRDAGEDLIAFLSEQDEVGLLSDGLRPQWYIFSTGKNSFAENLAASLNYDSTKLLNDRIRNCINDSTFVDLSQLLHEPIMKIVIQEVASLHVKGAF